MKARVLLGVGALAATAACSSVLGFDALHPKDDVDSGASHEGGADGPEPSSGDGGEHPATCDADLTSDPKNCGRCGHDCMGAACTNASCEAVKLADGLAIPEGIAVDETSIFVAEYDSNRILKFDKSKPSNCMAPPTPGVCIFTEQQSSVFKPTALAVDDTRVYWTNTGGGIAHQIRSCPRAGCGGSAAAVVANLGVEAFSHVFGNETLPLKLIVRAGRIFWSENGSGAIRSAKVDGSDPRTYFADTSYMPVDIAVDDQNVYFTDDTNQHPTQIQAVPLSGSGQVKVLVSTPARPFGLASSDSGILYWTVVRVGGVGDGLVQAAPSAGLDGGAPAGALASSQVEPTSILVDEKNVYWVQAGDDRVATGMVVYCPQTGCPSDGPVVLASKQNQPRHLAQDEHAIYWSNEGLVSSTSYDGQVWKIAKP